jgi:toxin ParE1/3/4
MKRARFHREARAELIEAGQYYERQRRGLGMRFRVAVQDAVAAVRRSPTAFSPYRGSDIRKCLVQDFPYTVFYIEFDADIWIAAVAHQRRQQDYWAHRSPDD